MATTIPGGATLREDGKTWQNANGEPLAKDQVKAVEALAEEKATADAEAEQALVNQALASQNVRLVERPAAEAKTKAKGK